MDEIIFADTDEAALVESSKKIVEEFLGRKLADSEPLFLYLKALLAIILQQRIIINHAANQNLLAFATNENLDRIGDLVGVTRQDATAAFTTVQIELSAARNKETVIPAGTRVSTAEGLHFALDDDVIFLSGETTQTAKATCLTEGEVGNNFAVGEINRIVDFAPYLSKISNITISEGGGDAETDDELRERIRIAPESFSVAGSRGAYEFWCKSFSTEIIDAMAVSPVPGYVDIYFLTEDGVPGIEMINAVQNYLSDESVRPMTDFVTVKAPDVVNFSVNVKYFISRENQTSALSIIEKAEKAVEDFILYTRSKLGRDINQTELYWRLRTAGVKRAEITAPIFTTVANNAVAICENINLQYGGLEDE